VRLPSRVEMGQIGRAFGRIFRMTHW
jgi:hypothetical protein